MASLTVLDNHDGTLTLTGSALADAGNGECAITSGPWVVDNGDGRISLVSTSDGSVLDGPVAASLAPRRTQAHLSPESRPVAVLAGRRTAARLAPENRLALAELAPRPIAARLGGQ